MIPNQHTIIEVLDKCLADIHTEVGPGWPDFCRDLEQLRDTVGKEPAVRSVQAGDDTLWQVCGRYPFIKGFILGYTKNNFRQLHAGGEDEEDDLPTPGVANRFQTLLAKLLGLNQEKDDSDEQDDDWSRSRATR